MRVKVAKLKRAASFVEVMETGAGKTLGKSSADPLSFIEYTDFPKKECGCSLCPHSLWGKSEDDETAPFGEPHPAMPELKTDKYGYKRNKDNHRVYPRL